MRATKPISALAAMSAGFLLVVTPLATAQPEGRAASLSRQAEQALQSGDQAAALRYFKAAVAAEPRSPEAACGLGETHLRLGQYEDAARTLAGCKTLLLERLRRLHSEQAEAYTRAEQEIREVRDTIRAIQTGQLTPSDPGFLGRLEDRIRELELLKTRDRVRVEVPAPVLLALGTAYLELGAMSEAEGELVAALRVDPRLGEAHRGLAVVYLAQQRWDECAEHVRRAEEAGVHVDPRLKADLEARRAPAIAPTAPTASTAAAGAHTQEVSIRHQGRTCTVDGMFIRLEASVTPSWGIHDPKVRFRSGETDSWYSATMLPADGDRFSVTLPKPRGARSFEYFIEVASYEQATARTDDFQVTVVRQPEKCPESSADSREAGGVLIVDKPPDTADAPPVPVGFSIRGTTADMGVLEIGANKALIAGGLALAGAAAAGLAVSSKPTEGYEGPKPFEDMPGVAFVGSDPPPGSTLSLSGGTLWMELQVYSLHDLPGARITAELASNTCMITFETRHDLPAARAEAVALGGPIVPSTTYCDTRFPLDQVRVRVVGADGLGGFFTGVAPLSHLRVLYYLTE